MEWLWASECAGCGDIGAGRLCPRCRAVDARRVRLDAVGVRGAWALARYEDPLGDVVRRIKVTRDQHLAVHLGRLLGRRVAPVVRGRFDLVVAAPSTPGALLRRGFALAAVLAEEVGREAHVPVAHALHRRPGRRQATLHRDQRRRNLVGRLICAPVQGRVLLVDDVATTGATASACATALLAAGAREVWLAVVCVAVSRPVPPLPPRAPGRVPLLGAGATPNRCVSIPTASSS